MELDVICQAKPLDPIVEARKTRDKSKQDELELYELHKGVLQGLEIDRLRSNAKHVTRVSEYDCGPCARCRVKDCDGFDCIKKKQGRL